MAAPNVHAIHTYFEVHNYAVIYCIVKNFFKLQFTTELQTDGRTGGRPTVTQTLLGVVSGGLGLSPPPNP